MLRPIMQAVIGCEAILGIALNAVVIAAILKISDSNFQHYRFCLIVSTAQAILYSLCNILCVLTHIVDHDAVYSTLNGVVLYLPEWAADFSMITWIILVVFSWTLLPAPFMLQYMIIVRFSVPTWRVIWYIYLVCLVISTPIFATVKDVIPLPSFAAIQEHTVRSMYLLSSDERTLVYGGTLYPRVENGNRSFALYIFLGVGLTFVAAYGIVLFCVKGILKAIREQTADNTARSDKSLSMQRRFTTMLMLEATVPFFFLGVTVGVFTLAGLAGVELGLYALLMSVFVAVVPAVQAVLYIWHLRGRPKTPRSPPHNTSTVTAVRTTGQTTASNPDSTVRQVV